MLTPPLMISADDLGFPLPFVVPVQEPLRLVERHPVMKRNRGVKVDTRYNEQHNGNTPVLPVFANHGKFPVPRVILHHLDDTLHY